VSLPPREVAKDAAEKAAPAHATPPKLDIKRADSVPLLYNFEAWFPSQSLTSRCRNVHVLIHA